MKRSATRGWLERSLHVVSGEVAAATFRATFGNTVPLLVSRDVLFAGPVQDWINVGEFVERRSGFLNALHRGLGDDINHHANDLLAGAGELAHERTIVWTAGGLEDTLLILLAMHLVDVLGVNPKRVRIARFGRQSTGRCAIGELTSTMLGKVSEPMELTESLTLFYRRAWMAYTSESPRDMDTLSSDTSSPDGDVGKALRLMLLRYPAFDSGLPTWELRLLRSASKGAKAAGEVMGDALAQRDAGDAMRDYVLFDALRRLADGTWGEALVRLEQSADDFRSCRVELTSSGRAVAEGIMPAGLAENAMLWIGGVCLPRAGRWVYDAGRLSQRA